MVALTDGPVVVHQGDVREVLAGLPAESVQTVVTSPPYWGLRDYGTATWGGGDVGCDHVGPPMRTNNKPSDPAATFHGGTSRASQPWPNGTCGKCGARRIDSQLGLEATPEEYVASMVEVFREVRRVLRKDGTLWLNLGDSYSSTTKSDERTPEERSSSSTLGPKRDGLGGGNAAHISVSFGTRRVRTGLKPKDLVGIPWRVAFALQADGWYLRSDIIWSKPNPMPESVTDRPTKAHEYLFLLTRGPRYYYDADAIRETHATWVERDGYMVHTTGGNRLAKHTQHLNGDGPMTVAGANPAGRNKRTVWEIATQPYLAAHFATFPEDLVIPCIKAGTSEHGCCAECGAPWKRVVETFRNGKDWNANNRAGGDRLKVGQSASDGQPDDYRASRTLGWQPACKHGAAVVPCVVLDPFAGSGTTLAVARRLSRKAIGIELQPAYLPLIEKRVSESALPLLEAI